MDRNNAFKFTNWNFIADVAPEPYRRLLAFSVCSACPDSKNIFGTHWSGCGAFEPRITTYVNNKFIGFEQAEFWMYMPKIELCLKQVKEE